MLREGAIQTAADPSEPAATFRHAVLREPEAEHGCRGGHPVGKLGGGPDGERAASSITDRPDGRTADEWLGVEPVKRGGGVLHRTGVSHAGGGNPTDRNDVLLRALRIYHDRPQA